MAGGYLALGMLPNSNTALITPPILPSKVFQAPPPVMGLMKPAMTAGIFMAFHCLIRMPLWGMSNTGMITWAPFILAFIRAGAKSLAPVGKVS